MVLWLKAVSVLSFAFTIASAARPTNLDSQSPDHLAPRLDTGLEGKTVFPLHESRVGDAFENLRFKFRLKPNSGNKNEDKKQDASYHSEPVRSGKDFEAVAGRKISSNWLDHETTREGEAVYPGFGLPPFKTFTPEPHHDHHKPVADSYRYPRGNSRRPCRIAHQHRRHRCHLKPCKFDSSRLLELLFHSTNLGNLFFWCFSTSPFILVVLLFMRWRKSRQGRIRLEEEDEVSQEGAREEGKGEKPSTEALGVEIV